MEEIAAAQARTEAQVDRLSEAVEALAQAQQRTENALTVLAQAQQRVQDEQTLFRRTFTSQIGGLGAPLLRKGHSRFSTWWRCAVSQARNRS